MRESIKFDKQSDLKQSKDLSAKPESARNKVSLEGFGAVPNNNQPMKKIFEVTSGERRRQFY